MPIITSSADTVKQLSILSQQIEQLTNKIDIILGYMMKDGLTGSVNNYEPFPESPVAASIVKEDDSNKVKLTSQIEDILEKTIEHAIESESETIATSE